MRSAFPKDPSEAVLASWHGSGLQSRRGVEEILGHLDPRVRQGPLGGPHEYNNVNYLVLGRLVEHVTGQPLATVLRRDLIAPAGLARVWCRTPRRPPRRWLAGRTRTARTRVVAPSGPYLPSRAAASVAVGAGSLAADAPSLARWCSRLYGGQVIPADLVAAMTTPNPDGGYGLGTTTGTDDDQRLVGHGRDCWPTTA